MASQKQLEDTGIVRKDDSTTQVPAPTLTMVANRRQCSHRTTITPSKTCSPDLYRRIKRRVGRSLKRTHCQRNLVPPGKQAAYKLRRTQGSFSSLKRVPRSLHKQDGSSGNQQHYSSVLHKQGGRNEVGPSVCPTLENLDVVFQEISDFKGPTHPRPTECSGRQAIQTRPDHSDRMVPPSRDFSDSMQQVAPTTDRPFCYEVQQQVTSVCVTSARSPGHCSRLTQSAMGGSGRIYLPTSSHLGQSGGEAAKLPLQKIDSYCPGMAQHALVLGPSGNVQPDPFDSAPSAEPVDPALQSDPSQKSDKPKPSCMAPRATAIKEQGISEAVAARIEATQRGSTRSVYEAKWDVFTKWCITHKVDFRSPPVKSVADFLLYLFEDRKLQPSTIDSYRSAIADKLGNLPVNISKEENLLDSFHRDKPKGRRGEPIPGLAPAD